MGVYTPSGVMSRHEFTNTYTNEYDSNQTNLSIVSPTGIKKIKVTGVYVSLEGTATVGYVKLSFADNTVFKAFAGSGTFFAYPDILIYGEQGGSLKLDSTLGIDQNFLIFVNYEEVL
jgi:hypothetical protein